MANQLRPQRFGIAPLITSHAGDMRNGPAQARGSREGQPTHLEDASLSQLCRQIAALGTKLDQLNEQLAGRRKENLTVEEVAALAGRAEFTIRRWIKDGKLKAIKISGGGPRGRLLVPRSEFDRLVLASPDARIAAVNLHAAESPQKGDDHG